ncbi:MAG: ABC transporter permease [bacterium]|nr:ABC transporter permease [bacterium]
MIKHHIKTAFRTLLRNKTYTAINILGLAVGIGICLLIYQYIQFELSYDNFHKDTSNTYRVKLDHYRNSSLISSEVLTSHGLGTSAKEVIPEIQDMVRIRPMHSDEGIVIKNPVNNNSFLEYNLYYVDQSFFDLFNYTFQEGNPENALSNINNIVLTKQSAEKYFGDQNAMGKTLSIKGGMLSGDFTVSGILEELPSNTHFDFEFLLPIDFMLSHYGLYTRGNGWGWYNFYTYITLSETANLIDVEEKFNQIIQTHIGEDLEKEGIEIDAGLQALGDIHLGSEFKSDIAESPGSYQNIWFFSIIAFIILIIVWVNYINLSIAQATQREKEIGVRKCLGAQEKVLVIQFLTESLAINLIASILGVLLFLSLLPVLNQVIGKDIKFTIFNSVQSQLIFLLIICTGAIISALYPSFVLSSLKPISLFKSGLPKWKGNINFRKALIGLQFLLSILLIAGTYVVYKQVNFMKNQNLGFDTEKIIVVPGPRVVLEEGMDNVRVKYKTFKSSLTNHHTISAVTGTSNIPGKGVIWYGDMRKLGSPIDAATEGNAVLVDYNFTAAYDLDFLAGSGFTSDMEHFSAVIINEKAVEEFNLGTPNEAIGQSIIMTNVDTLKIQGVIKDAHWNSLHSPIAPTIFGIDEYNAYFSVRANLSNVQETLNHIESSYTSIFPNDPFQYNFLNSSLEKQYQAEQQFGKLFSAFTLLAIFLACIGLFALVSFSTSLRTKEIGIRKVLGASLKNLILLLSKEYIMLLSIAGIASIPLIFLGGKTWLENYAYRIGMGIDILIIPIVVLLLISSVIVVYRTFLSSKANPVDSLRSE